MSTALERRYGLNEVSSPQYKTFEEMIEGVKEQMHKAERQILRVNWFLGLQAYIVQSNSVYGQHSMQEFADSLGVSKSTVYDAKTFYEKYSREDLEGRLVTQDIPYRRMLALSRIADDSQRLLLEEASCALVLDDEQLKALIDMANSNQPIPSTVKGVAEYLENQKTEVSPDTLSEGRAGDKDDDDDDDYDKDDDLGTGAEDAVRKASAPATTEVALAKELMSAGNAVDNTVSKLNEVCESLIEKLDHLSSFDESQMATAEKHLMSTGDSVRNAMKMLYRLSKSLVEHNIQIRS